MPAYFTRGSGHNEKRPVQRAARRLRQRTSIGWRASSRRRRQLRAGAGRRATPTARGRHHRLRHQPLGDRGEPRPARRAKQGIKTAYLRLRAYPFTDGARRRSSTRYERIYVVEQNRDAQMLTLMRHRPARPSDHAKRAQRAALQRAADRRAVGDRRHPRAGRDQGAAASSRTASRSRPASAGRGE